MGELLAQFLVRRSSGGSSPVTATMFKQPGSAAIRMTLERDASIGQLRAILKLVMPEQEFTQYVPRGWVVLPGDPPHWWKLSRRDSKFMLRDAVKNQVQTGNELHFDLAIAHSDGHFNLVRSESSQQRRRERASSSQHPPGARASLP